MIRRIRDVELIGAINDQKLRATVNGEINDETGVGTLTFVYTALPTSPNWHPLNYTDPLVLLPGYRDAAGGGTFRSLGAGGGSFTASCTMDYGNGLLLRKGATITVESGGVHTGGYFLNGTMRSGNVPAQLGAKYGAPYTYREYLHPGGPGRIIGVGIAPSLGGDAPEAVVSAQYRIAGWNGTLTSHLVRVLEIVDTNLATTPQTTTVDVTFNTRVEPLGT